MSRIPRLAEGARRFLQPGVWLLVWVYLYLVGLLALWVILVSMVTGWQPTVVTSPSMSPSIRPGDVLLVGDPGDEIIAQGGVITFDRPGSEELITHRVVSVEDDGYVTKGDANATPDTTPVAFDDVRGVGRLVVPVVGLPITWLHTNTVAFAGWIAMTLAALVVGIVGTRRLWADSDPPPRSPPGIAAKAMRRVRVLVGVLLVSQFITDESSFDLVASRLPPLLLLVLALVVLAGLNTASTVVSRRGDDRLASTFSIVELIVDTLLVVVITVPAGTDGIGWVLFSLPIVEAATRFRLTGALLHWMGLTAVALTTRIWLVETTDGGNVLVELEQTLDQLSVLLLVVVPGAYLAEQLVNDVLAHMRATADSQERSKLLQQVVETGQRVNELETEVVESLTAAAAELGFDGVDAWVQLEEREWHRLSTVGPAAALLPAPGAAASGLRPEDASCVAMLVDHDDPDPREIAALDAAGLNGVVRLRLSQPDQAPVMLRAALTKSRDVTPMTIEALQLLVGQAAVALRNDRLLTELQQAHDGLSRQATRDALTGLANRPKFLAALREALDRTRDDSHLVVVLFLDLDGFKAVNDRLGHDAGDDLLNQVAERLLLCVRPTDLVARFGGDEFTVLLDEVDRVESIEGVVQRISKTIERPFEVGHEHVSIAVSIGIASTGDDDETPDSILNKADVAMYHSKARPEVPWAHFRDEMSAGPRRRAQLASDLKDALAGEELRLVYQPIVKAGQAHPIVGVEALLRWSHPEYGPIPPPEVIELAEQTGLGDELHQWVTTRACTDAAHWARRASGLALQLTVNLSPAELESPRLLDHVRHALAVSGLDKDLLILELSERILEPGRGAYDQNLEGLAEMGISVVLDDFGAGRTSLGFLRSLPLDGIKLDRSFVVNVVESGADRMIVQSVVELAHELGLYVVAEGIETLDHLSEVEAIGCDLLQGYYLYKPTGAAEIMALVSAEEPDDPLDFPVDRSPREAGR